jgi:predicted ATP-dependent serine protease
MPRPRSSEVVATLAPQAREYELASLDELIASAGDAGGVRVVRGEAGIGKSTLLTAARGRAD